MTAIDSKKKQVLFAHSSSAMGGAERVTLSVIDSIKEKYTVTLVCPEGDLPRFAEESKTTHIEWAFFQYADNYDAEVVPGQYQNMIDVNVYNNIRKVDISLTKLVPQQYYPSPTDEEYTLGVFTRYFIVKTNEDIYTEINKNIYTKLLNQDSQYLFELYTIFKLQWTLVGGEAEVSNANRTQIEIREERLNRKGLKEFLNIPTTFRYDYLQFYAPNSGKILYTGDSDSLREGEEGLILPNGKTYIGYYHVMLDGTPMTGKSHNSGNNTILTRLYS